MITDTEPAEAEAEAGDMGTRHGRLVLITVELHRLRRTTTPATITTRGGHRHRVHVRAVGRRHTLVHTDGGPGLAAVLVPLRFIESVDPLEPAARQ
ncbi:hypothetical protein [Nocardia noduli]|uniref:hypothetical protein n=1 Tax=Nocardia noduli TaxID=2815722 RepID=UPI001C245FE2|nr:hypothetical protein [Nocardia noduli]